MVAFGVRAVISEDTTGFIMRKALQSWLFSLRRSRTNYSFIGHCRRMGTIPARRWEAFVCLSYALNGFRGRLEQKQSHQQQAGRMIQREMSVAMTRGDIAQLVDRELWP